MPWAWECAHCRKTFSCEGFIWGVMNGERWCATCLAVEVERLQTIVDKLPKDTNGVTVFWGDIVWPLRLRGVGYKWTVRNIGPDGTIEVDNGCGSVFWRLAKDFCKICETTEAAEGECPPEEEPDDYGGDPDPHMDPVNPM